MAGKLIKPSQKLSGSTILEIVISMVIIIVVFGIAMMIYGNVFRLSPAVKGIRAHAILQDRLLKINEIGFSEDNTASVQTEEFRIETTISPMEQEPELRQLTLTAFDENQQQVAQVRQIIISKYAQE